MNSKLRRWLLWKLKHGPKLTRQQRGKYLQKLIREYARKTPLLKTKAHDAYDAYIIIHRIDRFARTYVSI